MTVKKISGFTVKRYGNDCHFDSYTKIFRAILTYEIFSLVVKSFDSNELEFFLRIGMRFAH